MGELMGIEEIRLGFEDFANQRGLDLSCDFFDLRCEPNPYTDGDTRFAYEIWCSAIHAQNTAT